MTFLRDELLNFLYWEKINCGKLYQIPSQKNPLLRFPIDSVNRDKKLSDAKHTGYCALVDSFGWLAQSTRMNIAVAYACLATYQDCPSPGH